MYYQVMIDHDDDSCTNTEHYIATMATIELFVY